jgi:hypothetical protein
MAVMVGALKFRRQYVPEAKRSIKVIKVNWTDDGQSGRLQRSEVPLQAGA